MLSRVTGNWRLVLADRPTALFELLMRRHNQRIYRVVRSMLRDPDEIEDVIQQAYLQAFLHLDQFGAAAGVEFSRRVAAAPVVDAGVAADADRLAVRAGGARGGGRCEAEERSESEEGRAEATDHRRRIVSVRLAARQGGRPALPCRLNRRSAHRAADRSSP